MSTFEQYMIRAEDILDQGLRTESNRKDAIDYTNRAFDEAMREISDLLLKGRDAGTMVDDQKWRALYYGTPACHVWKAKHAVMFAAFPTQVEKANRAASFRERVKTAPLLPKLPTKKAIREIERNAVAKTCQICGRLILAETGVIAHHGYQRPGDGFQTASCVGARELPFEVSRDALGKYLVGLKIGLADLRRHRIETAEERTAICTGYEVYDQRTGRHRPVYLEVTRENLSEVFEAHPEFKRRNVGRNFCHLLADSLRDQDATIKAQVSYIKFQQGRFDGWRAK